jgi:aryl-alcohol dehydrogenase-like predicted oxidoreductase
VPPTLASHIYNLTVVSVGANNWQSVQHRIILGTANFGFPYGLSQNSIKSSEMELLMREVLENPRLLVETSPSYPNAEKIIGLHLKNVEFDRLVIKVPPSEYFSTAKIVNSVESSLTKMNQKNAAVVMLHGIGSFFQRDARTIERACEKIIDLKYTTHIGLSCYTEQEIVFAKKSLPILRTFQISENSADGRKRNSKVLQSMHQEGNTFQVRSIFLQGLLTMNIADIPANLKDILPVRSYMQREASKMQISEQELCIEYAKNIPWMSDLVIGVDNHSQLKFNMQAFFNTRKLQIEPGPTATDFVVDPRNWS